MDYILEYADIFLLDDIYGSNLSRENFLRQFLSLTIIATLGGFLLYFIVATLGFYTTFNHELMKHKRFLKNQVRLEIHTALQNIPLMSLATIPVFLLEVNRFSKLYDNVGEYGLTYYTFSVIFYIFFLDMSIYFIHRALHHPLLYKRIHKLHHKWLVPTPYASHAFYWIDGFLQSTPYHIFIFLFPLHKWTYLALFIFVNFWTVSIHDGYNAVPKSLQNVINGSSHHTDHHLYFKFNYGEFFTLWDILGGSHRNPRPDLNSVMEKDLDEKVPEAAEILRKEE